MTKKEEDIGEIVLAEEGPKRADRKLLSFTTGKCFECGTEIHFFKSEKHVCCLNCGAWTKKPLNGHARTI